MKRFIRIFKEIDDARIQSMTEYPLHEILLVAFLAVLANASGWNEIERFGISNQKWLRKFLELKNGILSHDTIRRVFSLIDPEQLQKATLMFLLENMDSIKKFLNIKSSERQLCIDGKVERGTGRKYGTAEKIYNLQALHIYDATSGICLCLTPIDAKTNEIPVAQEALKCMKLKGSIVTFNVLPTDEDHQDYPRRRWKLCWRVEWKPGEPGVRRLGMFNFTVESMKKIRENKKEYYKTVE